MRKPLNQVEEWRAGGRASAGGFNSVLAAVRALYGYPPTPGLVDSGGMHTRGPLRQVLVDQFQLISESEDYLTCAVFDGVTAAGAYLIAKPPHLRGAIATRTVGTEEQVIDPPYAVDDLIYAVRPRGGTNVTDANGLRVVWLDISPRRWAASCSGGSSSG